MANWDGGFSGRPVILRLWVNQDGQNIGGNYSTLGIALEAIKTGNTTAWNSDPSYWKINVNGSEWTGTWTYNFNGGIGQAIQIRGWFQINVGHNADGTKTVSTYADASDPGGYLGFASCGGSLGLTTIPRATVPTFPSPMVMGTNYTINLPRASSGFTHNVEYFFGSASGTIATGAGTSTTWTPPTSLLSQIPNSETGWGFIRVHTISGGSSIGHSDVTLGLTAPASEIPDFTTITHSEGTAGVAANVGAYVQAISKLNLAITGATGISGSTITSYKIEVAGQKINAASGTTPAPVNASGTVAIVGTVTDSRGRSRSKTVNVTFLPYAPPVITSISAERALASGVPDDEGTYVRINLNAAVQSLINSTQRNAIVYKIYSKLRTDSTYILKDTTTPGGISFNSYEAIGTYDIELAYDFRVEVLDDFSTTAVQFSIATAPIFMHWDSDQGVGFGKYRQQGMIDVLGQIFQNDGLLVLDQVSAGRKALLPATYRGVGDDPTITFLDAAGGTATAEFQTPYMPNGSRIVYAKRNFAGGWDIIHHSGKNDEGHRSKITLTNNWRPYNVAVNDIQWGTPTVSKTHTGIVHLSGVVFPGTITSGAQLGTLPSGFRPDTDMLFPVNNGDNARVIRVGADGTLKVQGSNWVNNFITLDNICFPAAGVATWTNVGAGGSGSAFTNSWVDYGDAAYGVARFWKDPYGFVWLAGVVKNGTTSDNTEIFTLPTTHQANLQQHLVACSMDNYGMVGAQPSLGVAYKTGTTGNTWVSLAGVTIQTTDASSLSGWRVITDFAGGWTNHAGSWPSLAELRREDGLCFLRGMIANGTFGSSAWLLAAELRSESSAIWTTGSNAARGRLDFRAQRAQASNPGNIVPTQGSNWFSLDSLKWIPVSSF